MMHDKNFLFTGIQPWDIEIGSNAKNIATEIAVHNKVVYVNPPLDRLTMIRQRNNPIVKKRLAVIEGKTPAFEQISENLQVFTPRVILDSYSRMPVPFLFRYMLNRNGFRFAHEVQTAVEYLDMKYPIVFCDSDMFRSYYIKDVLNPERYIYYSRDNLQAVPYWHRNGKHIEPKHMAKADLVLANSEYLAAEARKHNPRAISVGQGCDVKAFDASAKYLVPDDIRFVTGVKIGYVGALNSLRLDTHIIEVIANANPAWHIILVGPEDEVFRKSHLHDFSNVYFLGSKPESELPGYMAHMDVLINPQLLNPVTIGNYPRKIDEYLSMGKPVVATATKTMEMFSEHVRLADAAYDFPQLIEDALSVEHDEVLVQSRIEFAHSHTWEACVGNIYSELKRSSHT